MKTFKQILNEAKTGGATYEVGIIMGWHNIVGKKYNQSDAQVSNKNQKKVKENRERNKFSNPWQQF